MIRLALLLLVLAAAPAAAHESAEWIQRGAFKNAIGELCCGERDCAPIDEKDVEVTARGYRIKSLNETVPFSEALPTPSAVGDKPTGGGFWRCEWGGQRKCFFAPPPGS